jgi:hypothetical protein
VQNLARYGSALNGIVVRGISYDGEGADGGFVFGGVAIGPAGVNVLEQEFGLPHRIGEDGAQGRDRILIEKHDARGGDKSGAKCEVGFL